MSLLLINIPNYPLVPQNMDKEKNTCNTKKTNDGENLLSSVSFFLSCFFDCLFLDSFSFSEIIQKKPAVIVLDLSYNRHLGDVFYNNYKKIISEINTNLPKTKIITIADKELKNTNNCFVFSCLWNNRKTKQEFIKFLKSKNIDVPMENKDNEKIKCDYVIQDINTYLINKEYYKKNKINYFDFINCNCDFKYDALVDITYRINIDIKDLLKIDLNSLEKSGCHEIICIIHLDEKNKDKLLEKQNKIKEINKRFSSKIEIIPETKNNNLVVDFMNFLDIEKIKYRFLKNKHKTNLLFSLLEQHKSHEDFNFVKNRITKDIYCINTTTEKIIETMFDIDSKNLAIYLDVIHLLDGHFTVEEVINHLIKLHPHSTKDEIITQTNNCLKILLQKKQITKTFEKIETDENQKNQFHIKSVFPQKENLLLMYSGLEKGYFMINTKQRNKEIENISKEFFFFFLFSKGVYYIREIAEKLHLLLGDCAEFSKENYLKTTHKIYQIFKRYKLCK